MTLVEVVAGLALLASLLVGLLLTKAALGRQRAHADARLAAVAAADRLLSQWRAGGQAVPPQDAGQTKDGLRWRTALVGQHKVQDASVEVIRLEIAGGRDGHTLASVEILQPSLQGGRR